MERPTARRALNRGETSPGSPRVTRSQASESRSPTRLNVQSKKDKSQNDSCDEDELDSSGDHLVDEVDRSIPRDSPKLYPDISQLDSESAPGRNHATKRHPKGDEGGCSPRHTNFCTGRSPTTSRKAPVTPEKGSPGRKLYPALPPDRRRTSSPVPPVMYIVFLFIIAFCGITFYHSLKNLDEISDTEPFLKSIKEVYSEIKTELKEINSKFRQSREFWVQLIGQLETVMVENPIQPAVILAVVPKGAEHTAVCLSHKIAQVISDGFEDRTFVMWDTKSEVSKGIEHMKRSLFASLQRLENAHAAIVHNIEEIPGRAAMTFHAFCDNENAPFKQAVIILLIHFPATYEELLRNRLGSTIDSHLKGIWGAQLEEKDVSAVVSRVANAPVLIKPESTYTLDFHCQDL